ncbi:hypothetical protein N9L02_00520 [Gammaproteobacteria bacterium]|nr:hypothetical protein [Gammaproteobacteria bacterium]
MIENNKIRFFIRVIFAIVVCFVINKSFDSISLIALIFSTIFIMISSVGNRFSSGLIKFFILISMFSIIHFTFPDIKDFYLNIYAIIIAVFLGISANLFILPDRLDFEFQKTVIPLLNSSKIYFSSIARSICDDNLEEVYKNKVKIENCLKDLPIWVYESGFDLVLQKGYRFYFLKLNYLSEILFSMSYLARFSYDNQLTQLVEKPLMQCADRMHKWVDAIISLLKEEKLKEGVIDFSEDIIEIETLFYKLAPASLDFLKSHKDLKYFSEFIYNLQELRNTLLNLAKALR